MYDLLSLPTRADKSASIVANASEYADPPDYTGYFETRNVQYATLGLKAFALANRLRESYEISALDRNDWDPVSYLEKQLREIKQKQEQRVLRAEALSSQMEKQPPS